MIRTLSLSALLILTLAVPSFAQPSPIHLAIDYPTLTPYQNTVVNYGELMLAGWTMNCYTGQQAATLTVTDTVQDASGQYVTTEVKDALIVWRLARPDVLTVAPWICHAGLIPEVRLPSSPYLGFHIYFPQPLARGVHHLSVRALDTVMMPTTDPALGTKYWRANLEIR